MYDRDTYPGSMSINVVTSIFMLSSLTLTSHDAHAEGIQQSLIARKQPLKVLYYLLNLLFRLRSRLLDTVSTEKISDKQNIPRAHLEWSYC
jgi:hypothetical protein